ncbi:MAG TPA: glycosyltransferase [Noviherbaspirillum sp.]|nr:glycosyltransferase [Noviherbaspirillum sp.]
MPHVLHVISGLTVGGAEMALYRLITGSRDSTYKHAVVALTPGGALGQRLREAGIELTAFDFKRSPISHFFGLLSLMRRKRPDVVQTWLYHADMFGGLAARLAGNRNVIWGIRTTELTAGDSRITVLVRKICAWLSRWVPNTIVCVADAARRAHARVGYDSGRMIVVPNGFDLSRLVAEEDQVNLLRTQCGFTSDEVVIGTLGRFNAAKDQHNFIRAAGLLAQRHEGVRFLMVGRDLDAKNAELMHWIAQTGHADRFVLLGERTDVPVCLAAMNVFCLSSRAEAFPNVVGEAMAMGLPCVVTDVGDAAMLVADSGVVVPKEDSHALAQGVAGVLAMTPAARRELGQRAKARIHSEFTVDRTRERFEAIYQRLTKESQS